MDFAYPLFGDVASVSERLADSGEPAAHSATRGGVRRTTTRASVASDVAERSCIADVRWLYNIARSAVQPANMGEGFCKKPEPAMQCYTMYPKAVAIATNSPFIFLWDKSDILVSVASFRSY